MCIRDSTWATTAYYCEIHPGIISEAMGHSSITVTETYLKPFRSKKIDEANRQVLDFVKCSVIAVSYTHLAGSLSGISVGIAPFQLSVGTIGKVFGIEG